MDAFLYSAVNVEIGPSFTMDISKGVQKCLTYLSFDPAILL
jgi:hypothetical protein